MAKTDKAKLDISPIVTIILANYDLAKQEEYSEKFMSPLINGLLKRMHLVKAK
jgi:hypothetical protein